MQNQRERIVDATAATVAAKGLAGLTIPEIARRANISHQTFYEIYPTKHDAFLGALKVGMHQALRVTAEAYDAHAEDWPRAIAAGLRALIEYVTSEPAHARLTLVDTFAASPEAIDIRDRALRYFYARLTPGYELAPPGLEVPAVAPEAITGGIWQILHDYIASGRIAELTEIAPQIIYLTLVPFLGPKSGGAGGRSARDAQVGQHRQHAPVVVVAGRQVELGEDVRDVLLDRARRHHEALGDRRVRAPLGHQLEHLALARGQARERVRRRPSRGASSCVTTWRSSTVPPAATRAQRVEERPHVADPLLQQVADPGRVLADQLARVGRLHVLREHEHAQRRAGAGAPRSPPAGPRR